MSKTYRMTAVLVLAVALILLTACDPTEKVNAAVDSFMGYWKAGNTDKMAELMTSEVEFGLLSDDDAAADASLKPDSRGVNSETIAGFLIAELGTDLTYTISNTETYGAYAVVTLSVTETDAPEAPQKLAFHLVEVERAWKICLIAFKSLS